ncbi:NADPH:quinone reductase [Rhodobacterales bacterium]|nr:NADPH:quinone reductase [Rhodobacterales bacterium]
MKAIRYETFGQADEVLQFADLETPKAGPGQVLVRLETSGVNPSDTKKRLGSFPDLLDNGYVTPHSDGAGIVEAVGSGVSETRVGERVWIFNAQFARRFGTAAEYVAVDSRYAPALPEGTDFAIGACLGIPVMTAHRCVFADGDVKGKTLLVTGGAGRVGYYAIQWASLAGARVISTASNEADEKTCLEAGADIVVNHWSDDWPEDILRATDGEKVDRVIDVEFGTNLEKVLDVIRTGGVIATYSSANDMQPKLPFYRMMYMDLTIRLVIVYAMPDSAKEQAIADIDVALSANKLKHRIAEIVPLAECARAHEMIESGDIRGCVVLRCRDD